MALQAGFVGPTNEELRQARLARLSNTLQNATQTLQDTADWRQRREQLREQQRMNDFTQFQRFVGDANLSDLAQTDAGRQVLFKAAGSYLGTTDQAQITGFLQNLAAAPATAEQVAARAQSAVMEGRVVPGEAPAPAPMTTATPVNYDGLFGTVPTTPAPQGSPPPARGAAPVRSDAPASPGAQGGTPQGDWLSGITNARDLLGWVQKYNAIQNGRNVATRKPTISEDINTLQRIFNTLKGSGTEQLSPVIVDDLVKTLGLGPTATTPSTPPANAMVTPGDQAVTPRTQPGVAPQGASAEAQGVASASAPAEGEFRAFLFDNPGLVQNKPTSRTWQQGLLTDEQLRATSPGAYKTFLERRGSRAPASTSAPAPASAQAAQSGPTQPVATRDPTKFNAEQQAGWIAASKTPEGQKQLAARGIRVATPTEIVQWERENVKQAQAGERDVRRWVASKASKNLFDQERAQLSAYALNLVQAEGGPEANSFLAPVVTNWADLDRRTKEEQIKLIQAQIGGTYANAQIEWEKAKGAQMQAAADLAAANNEQFKQRIQMVEQGSKLAMPALEAIAKEPDPRRRQAALLSAMKDDPILSSAWSSYLQVTSDALDLEPTSLQSIVGVGVGDSFLNFILRRGGWGAEGENIIVATLPQMVSGSQRQATSADTQAGMDYTLRPAGQ